MFFFNFVKKFVKVFTIVNLCS